MELGSRSKLMLKILIPVAIGIGVIVWLFGREFDINTLKEIKLAQAEFTVHTLKLARWSVKNSGVKFNESEDEEISVSDTAHLRAEYLDLGVEGFGRGVCGAPSEVIEYRRGVIPECLDYGTEVVVAQSHHLFIPLVHLPHCFCR